MFAAGLASCGGVVVSRGGGDVVLDVHDHLHLLRTWSTPAATLLEYLPGGHPQGEVVLHDDEQDDGYDDEDAHEHHHPD